MTVFGVHTGLQHTSMSELRDLWRRIEALGYGWISVWDHFYAADMSSFHCHEAVAAHSALACTTERVRIGCLVYCAGYRHPAVLANAMATIDELSGGRADVGIGAGWSKAEYDAYGIPFPGAGPRLDLLDEYTRCVRGLLREETFDHAGEHFTFTDARCEPKPVQAKLPIWIGGGGEKRTLRIAAELADGWNVPFVAPDEFGRKRGVLHQHCATVGRDPREIRCAVNVGLAWTEDNLRTQFGGLSDYVRPGVLGGSDQEVVDRIGEYVAAGADQVNIAVRAPFDPEALDRLAPLLTSL
jgi:alkanesulfonate monooxygenase SsuD/methylene tetrahydromethanopterin reductase-like flavin-dependent oxidoreductase (luciferase family)